MTQPWTRVAAYGILVQNGAILLCRLAQIQDAGKWTLPGGGLNFGEHPEAALVRELREETGYRVQPIKLLAVDSMHFSNQTRPLHAIRIIYQAEILQGELRNEQEGTTDLCEWIPLHQAANLPLVDLAALGVRLAQSV